MEQQTAPDQLCQVLQQTAEVLRELTQIEQKKAAAASEKKHDQIDKLLRDQQAAILKLRGFEQRRTKLMDSLGFQGATFRQALAQADPALSEKLSPYFASLTEESKRLKQAKENSDPIIRLRLHEIEFLTAGAPSGSYESNGRLSAGIPPHFKDTYV